MPTNVPQLREHQLSDAYSWLPLSLRLGWKGPATSETTCREVMLSRLRVALYHNRQSVSRKNLYVSIWRYMDSQDDATTPAIIGRLLDRLVGVMAVTLLRTRVPGFKGVVSSERGYAEFVYGLPAQVLTHPALVHLLTGLTRDALRAYRSRVTEYFLPVATDDEVKEALQGNVELAREIVRYLTPNLHILSRSFRHPNHVLMVDYISRVGARDAFLRGRSREQVWALDTEYLVDSKYRDRWHLNSYWDGCHVDTLAPAHRNLGKS